MYGLVVGEHDEIEESELRPTVLVPFRFSASGHKNCLSIFPTSSDPRLSENFLLCWALQYRLQSCLDFECNIQ
jgi:hypothetical protein